MVELKGRPWKKVVPEQQYRLIEAILYSYSEMIRDVAEWKGSIFALSRRPDDGMPRGHAHISDPTSRAAISMASPPQKIESAMKWIDVVDASLRILKGIDQEQGTDLYQLCRDYYSIESVQCRSRTKRRIIYDLCEKYFMSETQFRSSKDLIVAKVWGVALWKGAVTPENEDAEEE